VARAREFAAVIWTWTNYNMDVEGLGIELLMTHSTEYALYNHNYNHPCDVGDVGLVLVIFYKG
jgi:hypothetical protein